MWKELKTKIIRFLNKIMDDDLDPKDKDLENTDDELDDFDDDLILGGKKPKKSTAHEDDSVESLDTLADEEDGILPEDSYDDTDLW